MTRTVKIGLSCLTLMSCLMVTAVAQADRRPACNPAAETHMKVAIRLMTLACDKPYHAKIGLSRGALTHVSLAKRFAHRPAARAKLCRAEQLLEHVIHSRCDSSLHPALRSTRVALELERATCGCGVAACHGGCQIRHERPHAWEHGRDVKLGYGRDYGYDRPTRLGFGTDRWGLSLRFGSPTKHGSPSYGRGHGPTHRAERFERGPGRLEF